MRKGQGVANPSILRALSAIGHTQSIQIVDLGMPIPADTPLIDVSITPGRPTVFEVLDAVLAETVIEWCFVADEAVGSRWHASLVDHLDGIPVQTMPHEALKARSAHAFTIIRTGEITPYANVDLVAGVPF